MNTTNTTINPSNPRIVRRGLGFIEYIDLATEAGYTYFAEVVTQDYDAADEVIARLVRDGEADVNVDQPEFYERYDVIDAEQWADEAIPAIVHVGSSRTNH